ncbi:MAG TPA: type II toxin-antitoxin system Phd/YefM family antitoxin [Thiolapillus brandeum]|uniref:Antitoxin n=1 Tax=Thiolapillus brandeum TaxID=1076588 RepID=A0A831K4J4_9GAMM|nr:type II toxin-antitoxin system Phd/YefM family antitoxin [Thiolapillus brandeum]
MKVELVTTLKRQATRILAELHESREPVLITEHGRPSAYLVDVEDFDLMERRLKLLEGIAKGEMALQAGNMMEHEEARKKMEKWLE